MKTTKPTKFQIVYGVFHRGGTSSRAREEAWKLVTNDERIKFGNYAHGHISRAGAEKAYNSLPESLKPFFEILDSIVAIR